MKRCPGIHYLWRTLPGFGFFTLESGPTPVGGMSTCCRAGCSLECEGADRLPSSAGSGHGCCEPPEFLTENCWLRAAPAGFCQAHQWPDVSRISQSQALASEVCSGEGRCSAQLFSPGAFACKTSGLSCSGGKASVLQQALGVQIEHHSP